MKPARDSAKTFCFTRTTAMVDAGRHTRLLARAHHEAAEVRLADAARRLEAGEDRDLLPLDETDAAAEEGQQALAAEAGPEGEDVRGVQEEGALLGEEEREAGQVGLLRVDLGLREVGVHGERGQGVGAEPLRHVQARLEDAVGRRLRRRVLETSDESGAHAEAQAEIEAGKPGEQARLARLEDRVVLPRARPAVRLLQPLDAPLDVQAPFPEVAPEAQRLDRDADLRGPAPGVARGRRLPLAVPVLVHVLAARLDERVEAGAAGVDREDVAGAAVLERVEDEDDVVLDARSRRRAPS